MNKLTIPAILVATVLVAGIFAFMPIQQASTVHTSGTITTASDADIDAILLDTGTTLPATLTTIDNFLDTEIAAILADTAVIGTPAVDIAADIATKTTVTAISLTAPGIVIASGTGAGHITCTGFTVVGGADLIQVGGSTVLTLADGAAVTVALSGQAATWVAATGADTATCVGVLVG